MVFQQGKDHAFFKSIYEITIAVFHWMYDATPIYVPDYIFSTAFHGAGDFLL
jgi:hypothetical protein